MKKQILALIAIAVIMVSCSKKSDDKPNYSINQLTVTLNYDKTNQFEVKQGSNDIDESKLVWSSSKTDVGTINASGLFTAKKIGKTTITGTYIGGSVTSEVTVVPYSTLCKEPVLEFGATISVIKSKETRLLSGEIPTGLLYTGENSKLRNIIYAFETNGLKNAILQLSNTNEVVEESVNFFAERYAYIGTESNIYFFGDNNTIVGLGIDGTLGFVAIYFKNTAGTISTANIQSVRKSFKQPKESIQLNKKFIK